MKKEYYYLILSILVLVVVVFKPKKTEHKIETKIIKEQNISKLFFLKQTGTKEQKISPWHDISLDSFSGNFNFICEIPKWTRKKFEITTNEKYNPIKQDIENGELREYKHGDMMFNYGAFPQTWEDPRHISAETGKKGDNDPLDVIEIGTKQLKIGSISTVKVLGILGLIDSNETDWKVISIQTSDILAYYLNDIEDIDDHIPGALDSLREWLRVYKVSTGNKPNTFAFKGKYQNKKFAMKIIEENHQFWKNMKK
eukprot:gene907-9817_t